MHDREAYVLLLADRLEDALYLVDEVADVVRLRLELYPLVLEVRYVEDVVYQAHQECIGGFYLFKVLGQLGLVVYVVEGEVGHVADDAHRGADVVAYAGNEVQPGDVRLLHLQQRVLHGLNPLPVLGIAVGYVRYDHHDLPELAVQVEELGLNPALLPPDHRGIGNLVVL